MTTIIDSDALIGLVNPKDALHMRAVKLSQQLAQQNATILTLPTTLSEFALVATTQIGMVQVKKAVKHLMTSMYLPLNIDEAMTKDAVALYYAQTSKEESLFDCFVMAAARKFATNCVFSFDRGYRKNGFTLIEDYFKN